MKDILKISVDEESFMEHCQEESSWMDAMIKNAKMEFIPEYGHFLSVYLGEKMGDDKELWTAIMQAMGNNLCYMPLKATDDFLSLLRKTVNSEKGRTQREYRIMDITYSPAPEGGDKWKSKVYVDNSNLNKTYLALMDAFDNQDLLNIIFSAIVYFLKKKPEEFRISFMQQMFDHAIGKEEDQNETD